MAHASTMLALGTPAPDFNLPNVATQKTLALGNLNSAKALVVIFLCAHCPYVIHVAPELVRVARDYTPRGVAFVGITSNDVAQYPGDAPAPTAAMARKAGLEFPILYDEAQAVARAYAAACTPDFFVFDGARKLVYRGQLDGSRPSRGESRPGVGSLNGADVRAALEAVLAGKPVNPEQRPSIGCNIKWKPGNEPAWFRV
jgi:peroxiredoxin